jgi:hypothetical protein
MWASPRQQMAGYAVAYLGCLICYCGSECYGQSERPAPKPAPTAKLQWPQQLLDNCEAFAAMYGEGTYGNRPDELSVVDLGSPQDGKKRLQQLSAASKSFPDSPFVGNTAFLLARAGFLYGPDNASRSRPVASRNTGGPAILNYGSDAEQAVVALQKVIEKYPGSACVSGDGVLRQRVVPIVKHGGRAGLEAAKARISSIDGTVEYTNYLFSHPNQVDDEAKYCIAWIIFRTRHAPRYAEAEQLLRSVIDKHRAENRLAADVKEGQRLKNPLISENIVRTECNATPLLIALLRVQDKKSEAIQVADDFAKTYQGHNYVAEVMHLVKPLRKQAAEPTPRK